MSDDDLLKTIEKILPLFQLSSLCEIGVALTDTEKFLRYLPTQTLDLKIKADDPIREGMGPYLAIREGKRIVTRGWHEYFRVAPFYEIAVPVKDESGRVLGAIVLSEYVFV